MQGRTFCFFHTTHSTYALNYYYNTAWTSQKRRGRERKARQGKARQQLYIQADMAIQCCHQCKRDIPSENMQLHVLRCRRGGDKREGNENHAQASSSSRSELSCTVPPVDSSVSPIVAEFIARGRIFGLIPCSFADLDALQTHFKYIPNSQQCRPNAQVRKHTRIFCVSPPIDSLTFYSCHVRFRMF